MARTKSKDEPMTPAMMGMRSLRAVLDSFCADQGLPIDAPAALDAARHCLVLASTREYEERELLVELRDWYAVYRARGQDASVSSGFSPSPVAAQEILGSQAA
jgi:hypothetical protein